MPDFREKYRTLFGTLGYELRASDGRAESRIAAAERKLGARLPNALREYYLVAGCERRFNLTYNQLLAPSEWSIDNGHLIFLAENQAVVLWGVKASKRPAQDPQVFQGVNGKSIWWYPEHKHCSTFLTVMLHWNGCFGGAMPHTGSATVKLALRRRLDRDWNFAGEVNAMRAYNLPGKAVCMLKWDDPLSRVNGKAPWRVFAGAATKELFNELAVALNVAIDGAV